MRTVVKCDMCGAPKEVTPYEMRALKHHFCSRSCVITWFAKINRSERMAVHCDQCGKELQIIVSTYKTAKHHYCNRSCYDNWQKEHPEYRLETNRQFAKGRIPWNKGLKGVQHAWNKGIPEFINCAMCGKLIEKPFNQSQKNAAENHFCSMECTHKWLKGKIPWNKGTKGVMHAWNKGVPEFVNCSMCGKLIEKPFTQSQINRTKDHFCSMECFCKWKKGRPQHLVKRRPKILVKCTICGKEFLKYQCHIEKHNFCSSECHTKWQSTSEEISELIGKAVREGYANGTRIRRAVTPKGGHLSEKTKAKMRGRIPWNKNKSAENEPRIKAMVQKAIGRTMSPATVERMRQDTLKRWQNPDFIAKQMKSRGVKPNNKELLVLEILRPFGFDFVGDGKLIIGTKCPDFWNGDHKLVEFFGDYWHRGEDPQDRINYFLSFGYPCLVIWERELKDKDDIVEKVKQFVRSDNAKVQDLCFSGS